MEHLECEFQYISCYSLSDSAYIRYLVVLCFNTSHVTLYPEAPWSGRSATSVSIHLMLLFIGENICQILYKKTCFNTSHVTLYLVLLMERLESAGCFNTSHVTLYHLVGMCSTELCCCFNTSHVTLYLCGLELFHPFRTFQYISCYSLSLFHILQLKCIPRFNTSHVTLYPIRNGCCSRPGTFQYISCYSLSLPISLIEKAPVMFQYISCYSLSGTSL